MTAPLRRKFALACLPLAFAACGSDGDAAVLPDTLAPWAGSTTAGVADPYILVFDTAGVAIGPHRVFARIADTSGGPADSAQAVPGSGSGSDRDRLSPSTFRSTNARRESP